nr:unnamed protein product [Callosobruchus chinensis]
MKISKHIWSRSRPSQMQKWSPNKIHNRCFQSWTCTSFCEHCVRLYASSKETRGKNNGDGTFTVSYIPPNEGANLKTHILYNNKDVPNSPFPLKVKPTCEPDKVKLIGPAIFEHGIPASLPTTLKIDTTEAGYGDLEVKCIGPDGNARKVTLEKQKDGTYDATFVPDDFGRYRFDVKYGGKEITKAPVFIQAFATGNAERCKITEGQEKILNSGESYCVTLNTQNAGNGAVTCKIKSVDGGEVDINIIDNGDGTVSIYYTLEEAGEYTINIKFGGQTVPGGFYSFTNRLEYSFLIKSEDQQFRSLSSGYLSQ